MTYWPGIDRSLSTSIHDLYSVLKYVHEFRGNSPDIPFAEIRIRDSLAAIGLWEKRPESTTYTQAEAVRAQVNYLIDLFDLGGIRDLQRFTR